MKVMYCVEDLRKIIFYDNAQSEHSIPIPFDVGVN